MRIYIARSITTLTDSGMIQLALLAILLFWFIVSLVWSWDKKTTEEYRKPKREIFSFKDGVLSYEEEDF